MEILEYIPSTFPIWLMAALLILNLFKDPLSSFLFKKFPDMTSGHFRAKAKSKTSRQEFEQKKEMQILQDKLAASESERVRGDEREKQYFDILKESMNFSQAVVLKKIDHSDEKILEGITMLKESIDKLSRKMGLDKT